MLRKPIGKPVGKPASTRWLEQVFVNTGAFWNLEQVPLQNARLKKITFIVEQRPRHLCTTGIYLFSTTSNMNRSTKSVSDGKTSRMQSVWQKLKIGSHSARQCPQHAKRLTKVKLQAHAPFARPYFFLPLSFPQHRHIHVPFPIFFLIFL